MGPILSLKNITKLFISGTACNNINLDFYREEVHTIFGIHGSGKTTLACLLYGVYKPDGGAFFLKDEKVILNSSEDAVQNKIAVIFNSFMFVQNFSIAENILVGLKNSTFVNKKKLYREIDKLSKHYGLRLNPEDKMKDASNWLKLRVEIARALSKNAEIIIIDEPTEFLNDEEVKELMMLVKFIASQGKSIVILSSNLDGILPYSDRVSVIRNGSIVYSDFISTASCIELMKLAYGDEPDFKIKKSDFVPKEIFFDVKLNNINFNILRGEIFGIVGLNAKYLKPLVDILAGKIKSDGNFSIAENEIMQYDFNKLKENKILYFSEENFEDSIIDEFSIAENLIYGYQSNNIFSKEGIIEKKAVNENALDFIKKFGIKTKNTGIKAKELSLEEKRKIFFARELYIDPQVLIVSNIKPQTSFYKLNFIHEKMLKIRGKGYSVLLFSTDIDEAIAMCDRIALMYQNKIIAVLEASKTSKEETISLMVKGGSDCLVM